MAHVRSNVELVSSLPFFTVKNSEDYPDWLIVTCPREDCGETFLVHGATWRKNRVYKSFRGDEHTIRGRSCPYCFRVGWVPRGRLARRKVSR